MVSIPPPNQQVTEKDHWIELWYRAIEEMASEINAPTLPVYAVAALPANSTTGSIVYVSDEAGGPTPAFFDGTDWRRMTDLVVVS